MLPCWLQMPDRGVRDSKQPLSIPHRDTDMGTETTTPRPSRFAGRIGPSGQDSRPKGVSTFRPLPPLRGVKDPDRANLARKAMDWPRPVLDDMAQAVGVSRSALNAYRAGQRRMPDAVALKLASWLRDRAHQAESLAGMLEQMAATSVQDPA